MSTSFLTREGPSPHTHSVLSQKHKVYSSNGGAAQPIGVISSFTAAQSRNIEPVRGIGFGDVIAELVPGVSEPFTLSVERAALYTAWMMQVFGYLAMPSGLVRALNHHRWPFDVKSEVLFSSLGDWDAVGGGTVQGSVCGHKALITYYEGCWFSSYSVTYTVDGATVMESGEISATNVTDGRSSYGPCIDTGNSPVGGVSRIFT